MPVDEPTLWGLFLSAFISSTLFPGGSEAVLAVLNYQQSYNPFLLIGVASAGNTLGGMSTWAVGRFLDRWIPPSRFTQPQHQRALGWLRQWGSPALILSWVPIVGDPLCLVAGWVRVAWFPALIGIAVGKVARYGAIIFLTG